MEKLLKIYDETCEVCKEMSAVDKKIADENQMEFVTFSLEEIAAMSGRSNIRGYVTHYHVDEEGMIDIPVYLILDEDDNIKGSSVAQSAGELENLILSWEQYKSRMSSASGTE